MYVVFFLCVSPRGNINNNNYNNNNNGVRPYWWIVRQSRKNVRNQNTHTKRMYNLSASFMVVAPASWNDSVWDDINRMKTLNTSQSKRKQTMHVCPLQLDTVERIIRRYSNEGETVFDPFAGLFTVPYMAVKMKRKGIGTELNVDYFRDGVGYMQSVDEGEKQVTLFDFVGEHK